MKSLIIAIVLILMVGVPAMGESLSVTLEDLNIDIINQEIQNEWNQTDAGLQSIFSVALFTDYLTTVADWHNGPQEQNIVLGKNPSFEAFTIYTGACMYLNYYVSKKIESKFWRFVWQSASVGIELYCINNNLNAHN